MHIPAPIPVATVSSGLLVDVRNKQNFFEFFKFNDEGSETELLQTILRQSYYQDGLKYDDMYLINIGANDGKTGDALFSLFAAGARGILVEVNVDILPLLRANVPWERAHKIQQATTPLNVVDFLISVGAAKEPDVFKIDIDSYDVFVVDALLRNGTFHPKLIVMEINEKIPPPIQFTINQCRPHGWRADHCYGVSIEKLVVTLSWSAYVPVALSWNNVYFLPRDVLSSLEQTAVLDTSTQGLYDAGYWKRNGRKRAFSYNSDVDKWVDDLHVRGPLEVMRDIFKFMIETRSFRESGLTFELSLSPGVFVV